jgi:hypothetical protein
MNIKELKKLIENLDDDVVLSGTIDIQSEQYYDTDLEIEISQFNDDKNKCVFWLSGESN